MNEAYEAGRMAGKIDAMNNTPIVGEYLRVYPPAVAQESIEYGMAYIQGYVTGYYQEQL